MIISNANGGIIFANLNQHFTMCDKMTTIYTKMKLFKSKGISQTQPFRYFFVYIKNNTIL